MLQVSKVLWQKTASPPFKSALSCENLDPIAHTNLSRNWLTYVLAVFQSLPVRQTYGPRYIKRSVAIGRIYALSDCIEFIGAIQINFIYLSVCLSVCLSIYLCDAMRPKTSVFRSTKAGPSIYKVELVHKKESREFYSCYSTVNNQ